MKSRSAGVGTRGSEGEAVKHSLCSHHQQHVLQRLWNGLILRGGRKGRGEEGRGGEGRGGEGRGGEGRGGEGRGGEGREGEGGNCCQLHNGSHRRYIFPC